MPVFLHPRQLIWFLSWKGCKTYPSILADIFLPRAFGFNTFWVMTSDPQCSVSWLWLWVNWELYKPVLITQMWNYNLQNPREERKGEAQPWIWKYVTNWPSALFPLLCLGLERWGLWTNTVDELCQQTGKKTEERRIVNGKKRGER